MRATQEAVGSDGIAAERAKEIVRPDVGQEYRFIEISILSNR